MTSNNKHVHGWQCQECGETKEIFYDAQHEEVFCGNCGLILYDSHVCKKRSGTNLNYYFDI